MDIRSEILKEHSKKQANKIVDYIGDNLHRFKVLVEVFLEGPYRVTQRAAWPLSLCAEQHPHLLKPHLSVLLKFVTKPGVHPAVQRNVMRLLQFVDIPKAKAGTVASLCFDFLQRSNTPVAVQAFAITVLSRIVEDEPELQREFRLILEDALPHAKPAVRVRASRALRALEQL
jgi:hypothetical protein